MFAMVGTWKMSLDGLECGQQILSRGGSVSQAVEQAVQRIESNPLYCSVGYGGLPAKDGQVYLDAGFMDGDQLRCGAVLSIRGVSSPIAAARKLCGRKTNWMLCGESAEQFAEASGIPLQDMRTPASQERWRQAMLEEHAADAPAPYQGHDTVCVLGVDSERHMACGTSTSGLFLKDPGRIGDSPIPGCGYYCDSRYGASAATGLGEDIMRGCLSYETVSRMRRGQTAQEAAEGALQDFVHTLAHLGEEQLSISLIALAPDGTFGAATTEALFPFSVALPSGTQLFACAPCQGSMKIAAVPADELAAYD